MTWVGNARPDTLYVLRPIGFAAPYKVGCSSDLPRRLRQLNNTSPFEMELLATMPGDAATERRLHAYLRHAHIRCEFFEDCAEIHQVIAAMESGTLDGLELPPPIGITGMVRGVSPNSRAFIAKQDKAA